MVGRREVTLGRVPRFVRHSRDATSNSASTPNLFFGNSESYTWENAKSVLIGGATLLSGKIVWLDCDGKALCRPS